MPNYQHLAAALRYWLSDLSNFSRLVIGIPLRAYQLEPARAILDSVLHGKGHTFAVMMSRQAGKNELSAQLEAYLLNLYRRRGGGLVKASPTYRPQTINSLLRLCDRMNNPWNRHQYRKREGYIVELDNARAFFFSAEPSANVVGATASILLEADEAQDISPDKWDRDFTPMGASTNVTTVFYGTAWTSQTFLARTIAYLEQRQARDQANRFVFRVPADVVAQELPEYGDFVARQVARLGRNHPLIRTQFFLETIDDQGGLFPAKRRAMMRGSHARRHAPEPGHRYALLIDVGGEDSSGSTTNPRPQLSNPRRDATAITVVDIILDRTTNPVTRLYHTVDRKLHVGRDHKALYAEILALCRHWHARLVVVDATGVGAGLASFLAGALGDRVIPIVFSTRVKSDLGWDFVSIIETGRYQDYANDQEPDTLQFWYEVEACAYEIRPGPGHTLRWGVWEAPAYDGLIARGHDDLLISAALCAVLDRQALPGAAIGHAVPTADPLSEIDAAHWR